MSDTMYLSPNGGPSKTEGAGPPTRILIATLEGVVTLARDGAGASWTLADRSLAERHIGALLYEPVSGKLFAGAHSDGGLWVSDDGEGADWRQLTEGLDRPHIYSLAARDVGGTVTLLAGTSPAALYRSDDLGESWTEVKSLLDVPDTDKWTFPPPPHIPHVKNIAFHPTDVATIFVSVEQGALLKSTDDGKSWVELAAYSEPDEIAYRDVHRLLINPDKPDQFYLATGEGLYRSDDGGESFEHLTKRGDRMGYPDFLFFDPNDDNTIYIGGSYRNPGYWYEVAKAESAVLRSTDGGKSWVELKNGLPDPIVGAFEAMSMHHWPGGMTLVIGTATGQIYASEDEGASWQLIADDVMPVSKDDHHLPFLTPEERRHHAEVRGIVT
jgi:photosystem II stability/assembly factor-like uncharacterized protein